MRQWTTQVWGCVLATCHDMTLIKADLHMCGGLSLAEGSGWVQRADSSSDEFEALPTDSREFGWEAQPLYMDKNIKLLAMDVRFQQGTCNIRLADHTNIRGTFITIGSIKIHQIGEKQHKNEGNRQHQGTGRQEILEHSRVDLASARFQ